MVVGTVWPGKRRYRPHHIGHKARRVFVRLVNQAGQCAAASQGSECGGRDTKKSKMDNLWY